MSSSSPRPVPTPAAALVIVLVLAAVALSPTAASGDDRRTSTARAASAAGVEVSAQTSRKRAAAGRTVLVTGRVAGGGKRPVVLETKIPGTWLTLATGRTNAQGRYRLRLPTNWYHRHALRVRAPAVAGRQAGTSRSRTVRVKPSYRPAGSKSDHDLAFANARWNPCRAIEWRFHTGGGFGGSLKVAQRAVAEVSLATGMRFDYAGKTSKVPVRDDNGDIDLVIGWATPRQVGQLSGSTVGFASARASGPTRQALEINSAAVALDRTDSLAEAYAVDGRVAWGQVMVHEIGHAIGLGHTSSSDQLMFGTATTSNSRLGKGDLRGMERLGLAEGCYDQGVRSRVADPLVVRTIGRR